MMYSVLIPIWTSCIHSK